MRKQLGSKELFTTKTTFYILYNVSVLITQVCVIKNQAKPVDKRVLTVFGATLELSPYLHFGGFFPAPDGVPFEGELVFTNDSPAVFVSDIGHHIHIGSPHLKLSLPVNDGGKGSADQEGTFGVAL